MKNFTREQFETIAAKGSMRKPTGEKYPGEDLCETPLELGFANGYSFADVCRCYATRSGCKKDQNEFEPTDKAALDKAYENFVYDVVVFAVTIIRGAPQLALRLAESIKVAAPVRPKD